MILVMPSDAGAVSRWFDEYLDTYAACARGDRGMAALLRHYSVPMIVSSDAGVISLMTDDEATAVMQSQLDSLRASGYQRTEVLHSEVSLLNSTCALYRATLSRRNVDGGEIDCPTITYLIVDDLAGLRIAVLAAHGQ